MFRSSLILVLFLSACSGAIEGFDGSAGDDFDTNTPGPSGTGHDDSNGAGGPSSGSGNNGAGTGATTGSGGSDGGGPVVSCDYPTWTAGTTYYEGDIVDYQGSFYRATHENPGYDPLESTWFWEPYSCTPTTGTGGTSGSGGTTGTGACSDTAFGQIVSEQLYNQMFPNRNALYTYSALCKAAAAFPSFLNTGSDEVRRREAAAFFANISHETTGGWPAAPGGPYAWGLVWTEETCAPSCGNYCAGGYPCSASYHGRGAMQLSWNYNYSQAGASFGVDLINNPDLVKTDSELAFKTAVWFWMTEQPPKMSCHAAMVNGHGFGETIRIINGGIECGTGHGGPASRLGFFQRYAEMLGVTVGNNTGC